MRARAASLLTLAVLAAGSCKTDSGPKTGSLLVTITGVPSGPAAVTVSGPNSYSHSLTATATLSDLAPGTYTVSATPVVVSSATYTPGGPASVDIQASSTPVQVTVAYALTSGALTVTVTGLPGGVNAAVVVTGPSSYSQNVTATTTLTDLAPGSYTVTANTAANGSTTYGGTPVTQNVNVPVSVTPATASVAYSVMTGSLGVTIGGLPGGLNPSVLVTGPFSYSHSITASGTTNLTALPLGLYTIAASNVSNGTTYAPSPATQQKTIASGALSQTASVAYAATGLDLTIDAVEIIQSTQSYTDTVPLVAGKNAYVRVFVKANQSNSVAPKVRLRWYVSGTLTRTDTISAPGASVPTTMAQGTLASSWNLAIPGSLLQANLTLLADVDPGNAIAETNEANNCWPSSCSAKALDVRHVPIFHQMIVPVKTKKNGATGNVNAGNMASYLNFLMKIHPVAANAQVLHATYTTTDSLDTLQSGDGNGMWETVLNEVTALRQVEDVTPLLDSTYYYGVVHTGYSSGVAGIAWVGGLQTATGWDGSINDQILAHETGHNWGNSHAWGCGATGNDTTYPNTTGKIDAYGLDPATLTLYDTASYYDVMSYCRPSWTSNHMYINILNYRAVHRDMAGGAGTASQPVLLLWGRMDHGRVVLEPAFEVTAMAKLPSGGGSYTIEGLDANGAPVFSYAFEPVMSMDTHYMGQGFVFAIPTGSFDLARLASMHLTGPEGEARVRGGAAVMAKRAGVAPPTGISARRLPGGKAHVSWDARYPMAMIRDARTGQVLSFARGNSLDLAVPGTELTVTLSDGVRSVTEAVIAQ